MATATRIVLQRFSYRVSAFGNPLKALREFQLNPLSWDLVLTGIAMAEMGGLELARRIWALRPTIPIVITTGYSQEMTSEKAVQMGFRALITKPTSGRRVAEIIGRILHLPNGWMASGKSPFNTPPFLPYHSP